MQARLLSEIPSLNLFGPGGPLSTAAIAELEAGGGGGGAAWEGGRRVRPERCWLRY
jgi:hypothetical protein